MKLFDKLDISGDASPTIDWELIPSETFAIFESWGGRDRIRSSKERFYYFYIDAWQDPPKLCLMERGIKLARVLAEIPAAPQRLIDASIAAQGKSVSLDKSYAISNELRQWIITTIIDPDDDSLVVPIHRGIKEEVMATDLPGPDDPLPALQTVTLRSQPAEVHEDDILGIVGRHRFYDSQYEPNGSFANHLVDNGDDLTVSDRVTGLMWQRSGCDLTTIRKVQAYVARMNDERLAGHADWRLPTIEEGLSLLVPAVNSKGLHLHSCFSREQPFIFLADHRKPGGYWFIDFKQGTVFWASGSIPGGFGRLCRSA